MGKRCAGSQPDHHCQTNQTEAQMRVRRGMEVRACDQMCNAMTEFCLLKIWTSDLHLKDKLGIKSSVLLRLELGMPVKTRCASLKLVPDSCITQCVECEGWFMKTVQLSSKGQIEVLITLLKVSDVYLQKEWWVDQLGWKCYICALVFDHQGCNLGGQKTNHIS